MKKIILIIFVFVLSIVTVYASVTVARQRKSSLVLWQGTPNNHFDPAHNVGTDYQADNSRFSFVNGTSKGENTLVSDSVTGLMWESTPSTETRYGQDSIDYCEGLTKGGYDDWRLPSLSELSTIVDYSRYNPAVNTSFFTLSSSYYWSSTTYASNTNGAWGINFYGGNVDWLSKENYSRLSICVR